jgi:hypothetical protein
VRAGRADRVERSAGHAGVGREGTKMLILLRVIAWPVWAILLCSFMLYSPILNSILGASSSFPAINMLDNVEFGYKVALIILLVAVAAFEIGVTFLLRHYLLNKPFRNDKFRIETATGLIRFMTVHVTNWLILCGLATEGVIFAFLTKQPYWSYPFFVAYLLFMILHSPRLAPYKSLR